VSDALPYEAPPYNVPPRRLSGTKVFFITILSVVIGMFLFFLLLIMFFGTLAVMAGGSDTVREPIVLEIDLRTALLDSPVGPTLFDDSPKSVVGIVQSLERAKSDDQIKGVFIRGETGGMAPASSEELRLALIDFRGSGKFVITHAQGLNRHRSFLTKRSVHLMRSGYKLAPPWPQPDSTPRQSFLAA
jgi:hypothetical protein